MALLQDLIQQIDDPVLRKRIMLHGRAQSVALKDMMYMVNP